MLLRTSSPRNRRAILIGCASVTLVAAGLPVLAHAEATPPAAAAAAARRPVTVTLVSGDRVTLAHPGAVTASVRPAPGREHVTFTTSFMDGRLRVVPSDALALLTAHRVDPRLFDVTGLVEDGLQDGARESVPLILRYRTAAVADNAKRTVESAGAEVGRDLPAVRGVAVTAPKSAAGGLWRRLTQGSDVERIWLDGVSERRLDVSVPQIGGPAAWQAGYSGKGVTVAVLDGGVDLAHPDLAGRVTTRDFAPAAGPVDGHATHVAGIIAGDGAASGGRYRGVAPEARVVNGRVCDVHCSDSALLAGMQWAAVDQRARVISMSIGLEGRYRGEGAIDPLIQAVDDLSAQTGALFVVAAGNSGSGDRAETIESPGAADAALTVGAVDGADATTVFSSRGPRQGDGAIKPDIAAPGWNIVAARAAGDTSGTPAADLPEHYQSMSGTSMATPHVAGAAVLLAQRHPDWTGRQIKAALMAAAKPDPAAGPFEQGNGRVDIARAITQTVTADPPSLSFGIARWPHADATAVSRELTFRNAGAAPVTLDLTVSPTTRGTPTPAGVFALGADRLTVPAGGAATVTVTADVTGELPVGRYTARVLASAGTAAVSTAIAIEKESEHHDLRLPLVGLDGRPAGEDSVVQVVSADGEFSAWRSDRSGTVTVRLPRGRYTATAWIRAGENDTVMFQPGVAVAGDTTLAFDARAARPVTQRVPQDGAVLADGSVDLTMTADGEPFAIGVTAGPGGELRIGMADPAVPGVSGAVASVLGAWAAPDERNSPYAYYLADRVPAGRVLTEGYHRAYAAAELAVEDQWVHADPGDETIRQTAFAQDAGGTGLGEASVDLAPGRPRTNHYSTDGVQWEVSTGAGRIVEEFDVLMGVVWTAPARAYAPGVQPRQEWGGAPLGVVLDPREPGLTRQGDTVWASVAQFGDGVGHSGHERMLGDGSPVTTTIRRDGAEVAADSSGTAVAEGQPDGESTYTVEQRVTGGRDGLGVERTVTFTVRSARPDGEEETPLPVIWVHAAPDLDDRNTATGPSGSVPLTVRDHEGRPVAATALRLEASFDDGRTWTATEIADGRARVPHPAGGGVVSLRMHAETATGATVTQTVIRAYRFANS